LNALRQVHEQGAFLTGRITRELLQDYSRDGANHRNGENHLTERERQVLQLIVDGKSNKEIAAILGISSKTVSVHRTNVMTKFDVQTTVELIRFVSRNHLVASTLSE
jgi:DNA-binding NarL/FixJ family response regulator